uniref:Uncharacterized protein n=1 Tax=Strongyloides papillosus TaxID=174720 RepID=A0A0N5BYE6_STREA
MRYRLFATIDNKIITTPNVEEIQCNNLLSSLLSVANQQQIRGHLEKILSPSLHFIHWNIVPSRSFDASPALLTLFSNFLHIY